MSYYDAYAIFIEIHSFVHLPESVFNECVTE